jgi:hypothetical protein
MSPNFTVKKIKPAENPRSCQRARQNLNPPLLTLKPWGMLMVVSSGLYPLWFFPPMHRTHCHMGLLSPTPWHTHEGQKLTQMNAWQCWANRQNWQHQLCPRRPWDHKGWSGQSRCYLLLQSDDSQTCKQPLSGNSGAQGSWQPTGIVVIC